MSDPKLAEEFFRTVDMNASLDDVVRWLNEHGYRVIKLDRQHYTGTLNANDFIAEEL